MTPRKLYAVVFPHQQAQIEAWCWGEGCGKGSIGALNLGDGLEAVPCTEETCPHVEREMGEPFGEAQGCDVYLRKLKEVQP